MAKLKKNVKALMKERRAVLIKEAWPNLESETAWDRHKSKGFTTIPRCMPFFIDIMDQLSSGSPLSSVYFSLWCHASDEGFIHIKNETYLAFEAGHKGQRGVSTWRSKMKKLKELGFILGEAGVAGEFTYTLIVDPYRVTKELCKSPSATADMKMAYRALNERAIEVGATDLED